MNAVIIYDDHTMGARAGGMLQRAALRADEALLWKVKPWRCDLLLLPAVADLALGDAQSAQLIVLALRDPAGFSPRLLDWLDKWAGQRHVTEAALAVFDGRQGDSCASAPTRALSQFAERHGLCFIVDDVIPSEDETVAVLEDLHEQEVAQTPTLARG